MSRSSKLTLLFSLFYIDMACEEFIDKERQLLLLKEENRSHWPLKWYEFIKYYLCLIEWDLDILLVFSDLFPLFIKKPKTLMLFIW
jgi:hypothetical protein